MKLLSGLFLNLLLSQSALALVSQALPVNAGESVVDLRFTREGGKMKPTSEKDSWQNANNRITSLSWRKGVESARLSDLFYSLEYRFIETPHESLEGETIHGAHSGHQVIVGAGTSLYHTLDARVDVYFKFAPLLDVDEEKFAQPRSDLAQLGIVSGFNATSSVFFENVFHIGSGIPQAQNMYLLLSQAVGLRRGAGLYKFGPYVEADLESRKDERYGQEKIQLYKAGILFEMSHRLNDTTALSVSYLQKIFGQYLPATNAVSLALSKRF